MEISPATASLTVWLFQVLWLCEDFVESFREEYVLRISELNLHGVIMEAKRWVNITIFLVQDTI